MMPKPNKRDQSGFTLIELMVVVVIIGVLAAMAIPRWMHATTRTKQSEAKQVLKQIYTMERMYKQVYDTYSADLNSIGVEIMVGAKYAYVVNADAATFEATATANLDDDAALDTWVIDETGVLTNTVDDATT